uniref:40S ribosomal protein S6 n=1 Tax=Strongyloides stercoralis TaxID=6248 RepID=A0A0K0EBA3_STRER
MFLCISKKEKNVTLSFRLENFDSEGKIIHSVIQENDLTTYLKNKIIDEADYLSAGKIESYTRQKRQSPLSRRRGQSVRRQSRQRFSRNQRKLSPAAIRRARKREIERRRRLLTARHVAILRRPQTAARPVTTTIPSTVNTSPKEGGADPQQAEKEYEAQVRAEDEKRRKEAEQGVLNQADPKGVQKGPQQ